MTRINLHQANEIIAAAFTKGKALSLRPLAVAVHDAGAHLISCQRQDGAPILLPQIAMAKAGTALALGLSSRTVGAIAVERPSFVLSLAPLAPLSMVPVAGGVLVLGPDGQHIGAVGVGGDTPDNDELCALAGIETAGLIAYRDDLPVNPR